MKKSRLNLPHIKMLIAFGIANGHSQRHIAQTVCASQPAISRIAKHDDVRELIRQEEKKLCQKVKELLEEMRNDPMLRAKFQKALEKEILNFKRYL